MDAATGAQKWAYDVDGDILWSVVDENVIYIFLHASYSYDSDVCAVNASDGALLWRWNAGYYVFLSEPTISDGEMYFGSYGGSPGANDFYALDTADGMVRWNVTVAAMAGGISTVADGVVYTDSGSLGQSLVALDAQNGSELWTYPIGYFARSSPTVVGGIVYVDGREGTLINPNSLNSQLVLGVSNVYALNASNGNRIWNFSGNDKDYRTISFVGDIAFFCSNDTLYALNAKKGLQLWSLSTGESGTGICVVNGDALYYYSGSTLYDLDSANGMSYWNYTNNEESFLAVEGGVAFFYAGNSVYGLGLPGSPSASSNASMSPNPTPSPSVPELQSNFLIILIVASIAAVFCSKCFKQASITEGHRKT